MFSSTFQDTSISNTCTGFILHLFNGKEKDDEWNGTTGGLQDYGMRMYDARACRFISVDPLTNKYPQLTPYQFATNNPIMNIDIDGMEGSSNTTPSKEIKDNNGLPAGNTTAIDNATNTNCNPLQNKPQQLKFADDLKFQSDLHKPSGTLSGTSNYSKFTETMAPPVGDPVGNMVRFDPVTKSVATGGAIFMTGFVATQSAPAILNGVSSSFAASTDFAIKSTIFLNTTTAGFAIQGVAGAGYSYLLNKSDANPIDLPVTGAFPIFDIANSFTSGLMTLNQKYSTTSSTSVLTTSNSTTTQVSAQSQTTQQAQPKTKTASGGNSYTWSTTTTPTATPAATTKYSVGVTSTY